MTESTVALEGRRGFRVTDLGLRLRAYHELAKPGLVGLVVLTGVLGFCLGAAKVGHLDWMKLVAFVVGTAATGGGACALNMFIEREADGRMRRTRDRPIPSGRLRAEEALAFALVNFTCGFLLLGLACGGIPAVLSLLTAVVYAFVYTPLKRRGPVAVAVGAVPGAIPPLMGWAAATGTVQVEAWSLFALLFAWQFPHFLALAFMYREDYARGGFRFLPQGPAEGVHTGRAIAAGTAAAVVASLGPVVFGLAEWVYGIGALAAGIAFARVSWAAWRSLTPQNARRVFLFSITYLPALLFLLVLDQLISL
jgi:protoheme IX farnesyltransferase